MLENMRDKRLEKRIGTLQKRIDRLTEANAALKAENTELEQKLIVCRAKLDSVDQYEQELQQVLSEARAAKHAYDDACRDLKIMRKKYEGQVEALIQEMKAYTG